LASSAFHRRLLIVGRGGMLEADDVHAGHFQLHGDALSSMAMFNVPWP
jgi:hypothetical protein